MFLTFLRKNSPNIALVEAVAIAEESQFRISCLRNNIINIVDKLNVVMYPVLLIVRDDKDYLWQQLAELR